MITHRREGPPVQAEVLGLFDVVLDVDVGAVAGIEPGDRSWCWCRVAPEPFEPVVPAHGSSSPRGRSGIVHMLVGVVRFGIWVMSRTVGVDDRPPLLVWVMASWG